jgi:hypothetical protein
MEAGLTTADGDFCFQQNRYVIIQYFVFSHYIMQSFYVEQTNWSVARDTCCELGMRLISLEFAAKQRCFVKMLISKCL